MAHTVDFTRCFSILWIGGGMFFLILGVIFTASGAVPPGIASLLILVSLIPILVGWSLSAFHLAGSCREDSSNPYLEKDDIFVISKIFKIVKHSTKQVKQFVNIFMN